MEGAQKKHYFGYITVVDRRFETFRCSQSGLPGPGRKLKANKIFGESNTCRFAGKTSHVMGILHAHVLFILLLIDLVLLLVLWHESGRGGFLRI